MAETRVRHRSKQVSPLSGCPQRLEASNPGKHPNSVCFPHQLPTCGYFDNIVASMLRLNAASGSRAASLPSAFDQPSMSCTALPPYRSNTPLRRSLLVRSVSKQPISLQALAATGTPIAQGRAQHLLSMSSWQSPLSVAEVVGRGGCLAPSSNRGTDCLSSVVDRSRAAPLNSFR